MTIDERVRDAMHAYADPIEPDPGSWDAIAARLDEVPASSRTLTRRRLVLAGLALGLVVVLVTVLLVRDEDTTKTRVATGPVAMPKQIVALTTSLDLVVLDSTTGAVVRTLAHDVSVSRGLPELAPTPDGKSVYFTSHLPADPACPSAGAIDAVFRVGVGGGTVGHFGTAQSVAVSPDGRWLATAGGRGIACSAQPFLGISLQDVRTGQTRAIPSTTGTVGKLSWSPNSRDLAFQWYKESSYAYTLDTQTAISLDQARCLCGQGDGSRWFGYLGPDGFLGTSQPSPEPNGANALGPDGAPRQRLFWFDGTIDQLRADASGTQVLVVGGQMKNRIQIDDLYRWSRGDERPTKIADSIVGAAWIPDTPTTPPPPAPTGVLATKDGGQVVAMGSSDGAVHETLATVPNLRWLSPVPPQGLVAAYGTESRNGACLEPRAEIGTIDLASPEMARIVSGAIAPTVSPDGRFVAYGILCDGVTLGFSDLRDGTNYRTDPFPSNANLPRLRDIAPVAWAPDGQRLLYRVVFEGSEDPRFWIGRLWPQGASTDAVALPVDTRFSAAAFVDDETLAIASDDHGRSKVWFVDQKLQASRGGGFETPGHITQLVPDSSGRHFLAVTDDRALYRWSVGEQEATKLADDVTSAAWIPWS